MLLDEYRIEVHLEPDEDTIRRIKERTGRPPHFTDEEVDAAVAQLEDLGDMLRIAAANWVAERLPGATVKARQA